MKIIEVSIEKLKFNKDNLRINVKENDKIFKYLLASILTFGLQYPLLIDKDFVVISGNQILRILKYLHYKEVFCIVSNVSREKEMNLSIVLNKIHGDWNIAKLIEYFKKQNYSEKELKIMGWKNLEVDSLLAMNKLPDSEELKFQENKQKSLF